MRRVLLIVLVLVLIVAILPGWRYYKYLASHVSTDDAYVDGTIALLSSRIPGTVTRLFIEDNWKVEGGQLLLTLDPVDYQVRVAEAQAQLERAQQSVDQLFAQLDAAAAGLNLAGSQLHQAQIDYDRARKLSTEGVVSREYYDQAATGLRVAVADRALAEHQVEQARAALGGNVEDHPRYERPIVEQARAALSMAKLDLGYTEIRAPLGGIVTRKSVHVGNRIQPGEPLLAIVPVDRLYITANYKETQLTDVRVGQPARVEADIYPGYVYAGHVDSISVGTGAAFALLPPENATGNWVKVVQRIPVKVVLNQPAPADKPLRVGLSVDVAIDISRTNGPLLSSTLQRAYDEHSARPGMAPERLQTQADRSAPGVSGQPVVQP
ncbi:MAG: efflux RND transporter periplasmic adaptor subunit [Candidatus Binataceae bacterium]